MTEMVKGNWFGMLAAIVAGPRAWPLTLSGHRHARSVPQRHGRVRSAERAAYRPPAVPAPSLVAWPAGPWARMEGATAAEDQSAPGPGIRLVDLSDYPTHTAVDRFEVEVSNLTATVAYQVIVSSDSAGLGIGACGTASQTETVTGVAAQTLTFFLYVCTEDSGTLTAELRPSGSTTSLASVSQRLAVLAVPELAPGTGSGSTARAAGATAGAVARVGTPGTVPSISFPVRTTTSIRASWGKPSDGGRDLTGFGLLFWRASDQQPDYGSALVKGAAARCHTYTRLQAGTTYKFRIHACNGPDSCGWWTDPAKQVTTPAEPPPPPPPPTATATAAPVGTPHAPHSLGHTRTATSFTFTWSASSETGGAPLTGFGILQWEQSLDRPDDSEALVVGAGRRSQTFSGLKYGRGQRVEIQACNGPNRCSAWASLTVPAMSGLLPTIALPKTRIEIGEQISVGANDVPVGAVAWLRVEGADPAARPLWGERRRAGAGGAAGSVAVARPGLLRLDVDRRLRAGGHRAHPVGIAGRVGALRQADADGGRSERTRPGWTANRDAIQRQSARGLGAADDRRHPDPLRPAISRGNVRDLDAGGEHYADLVHHNGTHQRHELSGAGAGGQHS